MLSFAPDSALFSKALETPFSAASRKVVSSVRFGRVDCTVHGTLAQQFGVKGYPTVLLFPAGAKSPKLLQKYEGGRDEHSLYDAAIKMLSLKNIKLLSTPAQLLAFFTGSAKSAWAASLRPSLLIFLHAHKPSLEMQGLSQAFQNRVQIGVVPPAAEKSLRGTFSIKSNPTYLVCVPAVLSSTNRTGAVTCMLYDHAADNSSKGAGKAKENAPAYGGSSVPSVSRFLVAFINATRITAAGASLPEDRSAAAAAAHDAFPALKQFVIDQQLAASDPQALLEATRRAASAASLRPPPVASLADFHARCTDTALGLCLLVFVEPAWVSAASADSPVAHLLDFSLPSWNSIHQARKSKQVSTLLLPTSSVASAALASLYSFPLDSSARGVTLLALLPSRNRFVFFERDLDADHRDAAIEWIEALVQDDTRSVRPQKLKDLQPMMRTALQEALKSTSEQALFASTFVQPLAEPEVAAAASAETEPAHAHEEL